MESNKELYNKFFSQVDIEESALLSRIKQEQAESWEFMNSKIDELTVNFELYKNVNVPSLDLWSTLLWQVWDETTYATVNALMARSISESVRAEFESNNTQDDEVISYLNTLLEEDYEDEDMLAVDLYWAFYKYVMGVYIKFDTGWNWKDKKPIFNFVDPRLWRPDPNWDYLTWAFSYSGFETFISKYAIDDNWLDKDALVPYSDSVKSAWDIKKEDQATEWYNTSVTKDNYYEIYHHYFYVTDKKGDKRKAMATLWNGCTVILKLELIENPSKNIEAEFPFSFEYFGAEPNNPLGDNVVNHTAEPQKVKAFNRNLRIAKAKAQLEPMYFYNEKYVTKSKLWFWFNKFIPVDTKMDWAVNLDSIIKSFSPDVKMDASLTIDADVDAQVERATSVWANMQWSTIEWNDTKATEMNLIQGNADINITYRDKIGNIGKKQAIKVYLQSYIQNYEDADKRIVLLDNWIGTTPVQLKKKYFLLAAYSRIKVKSKAQIESQRKQEQMALSQLVNLVMSSDMVDDYQKLLMLQDYAKAFGYPEKYIKTRLSGWPEEETIKMENEILNENAYIPIQPDDNHLMHILLQKPTWESNEAVTAHFTAHIQEWVKQGKQMQSSTNGTQQAMQSSMAASNNAQLSQGNTTGQAQITTN